MQGESCLRKTTGSKTRVEARRSQENRAKRATRTTLTTTRAHRLPLPLRLPYLRTCPSSPSQPVAAHQMSHTLLREAAGDKSILLCSMVSFLEAE